MPELVVSYLDGTEERYPLAGQDVFIGRDTQLLVSIPDSKISRRHARVFLRRGAWFIEDLGSVNGVIVDGVRITTAVPLSTGKGFHIGDEVLRLVDDAGRGASAARPAQAPPWQLIVTGGPLKGQVLALSGPGSQIVGRDAQGDLAVADASVSRKHARLVAGPHEVAVEDLGSSNGTFINDQATSRGVLRPGDVLRLGNVPLQLRPRQPEGRAQDNDRAAPGPAPAPAPRPRPRPERPAVTPGRRPMVWAAAATLAVLAGTGVVYALRSGPGPAVRTQATPQTPKGVEPPNDADAEAGDDAQGRAEAPAHKAAAAPVPPQTEATTTPEPQAEQATKAQRPRVSRPATGVRGRLGRAWARAIGQGPGAAERARARAVTQLYSQALAQSRSADREGALATLQDLLAQDALHPAGRALQGQLLLHEDEANALRKAQTAMQAGQALEALGIVSQALDRPFHAAGAHGDRGQQTAPSTEAQELRALGDQAALQLGQACGERAQAACMAQAWEPCIVQLACFLGYQPQTVQGLALLTLAMDAVRGHALGQTPAKEGAPAPGQQPMVVAQEALGALTERYPQAALRQAVLVYSTGDIAAASQKLHPLTCRQCRVVGGDVRRVALGLPRAKQLRESGQHAAAQALYDEILAADSRLCPPPTPSVLHNLALEGKQAVFLLQGSAAFERGAYKEALSAYLAGIRLGLSNDGLQEAVARLSRRAQDIFSSVQASVGKAGDSASLPAPVCSHLREVLDMTTAEDPTHKRAEGLLARCKGKH